MGGTPEAELADAAHILRRTSFGPFPGSVRLAIERHGTAAAFLDAQLAAEPIPFEAPPHIDEPLNLDDTTLGNSALVDAWYAGMTDDLAGLHDKMMWFWHTHFTTSFTKSAGLYCWRQLRLLHTHALGNFGDLAKAMCIDGAMLQWLDGGLSRVQSPNENFARELMELFTMGRGNYTEEDVRAAALALSGWAVPRETPGPVFDPSNSLQMPVTFLGRTAVFSADTVIDRILEQAATAPYVVGRLAAYLVGASVPSATIATWADLFRSSGYEIRPVVEAMLRSDEFRRGHMTRSRTGIEWICITKRCAGMPADSSIDRLSHFAQVPYAPINVAGWPDTWLSTSSLFARASYLAASDLAVVPLDGADPVTGLLERCGMFEVSDSTRWALRHVQRDAHDDPERLLRATLLAPEYALQ